jgi:hypothetical protein
MVIAPVDHDFEHIWSDVTGMNKLKTLMAHLLRIAKT